MNGRPYSFCCAFLVLGAARRARPCSPMRRRTVRTTPSAAPTRPGWHGWRRNPAARFTIRPIWSGGLISSDQSLIELRHGVADIGLITPIYAHGGAHLLRVQTGFYAGAKTFEQQVANVSLPGGRLAGICPGTARLEGAGDSGRHIAGSVEPHPRGSYPRRFEGDANPSADRVAQRDARSRCGSGDHAHGRGVFELGERRARCGGGAGRHFEVAAFWRSGEVLHRTRGAARRLSCARHERAALELA